MHIGPTHVSFNPHGSTPISAFAKQVHLAPIRKFGSDLSPQRVSIVMINHILRMNIAGLQVWLNEAKTQNKCNFAQPSWLQYFAKGKSNSSYTYLMSQSLIGCIAKKTQKSER